MTAPPITPRRWDDIDGSPMLPNLNRLLIGRSVTVTRSIGVGPPGGEDRFDEPTTFAIEAVTGITVGLDSDGIFGGVKVAAGGREWTLYNGGSAEDAEGRSCTHDLNGVRPC